MIHSPPVRNVMKSLYHLTLYQLYHCLNAGYLMAEMRYLILLMSQQRQHCCAGKTE